MMRLNSSKLLILCLLLAAFPAASAVVEKLSAEQLFVKADGLVVARLLEKGPSFWRAGRIYTRYTFVVEQGLGSAAGRRQLVLEQPGGQVGRWRQQVSGYPEYQPGRRLLLFLEQVPGGFLPLGLSQGVFVEVDTPAGKRWRQCLHQISTPRGQLEPLQLPYWNRQGLSSRWKQLRGARP